MIAGVGASAGLGAALGRRFARGGYAVVLTGRTHERVAAVADEIRAQGGVAHVASGDIASEADVERLAIEVRTSARCGPPCSTRATRFARRRSS